MNGSTPADATETAHRRGAEQDLSHREIARACVIGPGTVSRYLERVERRGLGWPLPAELNDTALAARLFPRRAPLHDRARPDCAHTASVAPEKCLYVLTSGRGTLPRWERRDTARKQWPLRALPRRRRSRVA